MLYLKSFHVIFMVTWFAALFYLPRLFVYHALATDAVSRARFVVMERKLFWGIMTPGAVATISCGMGLLYGYAWELYRTAWWLHVKLGLVGLLLAYHGVCFFHLRALARETSRRSHVYFRVFNELPVFALVGIVILAIVKPS